MDIVDKFKNYLLTEKNTPTPITIKNYLSDVRRFLNWFYQKFKISFTPDKLTSEVISQYQTAIQSDRQNSLPAARSAKRYISSLRRFCSFLVESGEIKTNPFFLSQATKPESDPFFFKEFKNFLFTEHASKLTIKNYLADVKQFLDWFERVTNFNENPNEETQTESSNLLELIDNYALEQYKSRLLNEAKLSPVSINRKLSSLRRYLNWLGEKGIVNNIINETPSESENAERYVQIQEESVESFIPELPLTALQGIAEENQDEKIKAYSHFAPVRLAQKTTKIINLSIDLLFFNPIVHLAEAIHYSLWKNGKKAIFAPVTTILESSSYVPKAVSVKTIIPKATSMIPPRSANLASVLQKVKEYKLTSNAETVHNFTKALYAPLLISTKHMSWQEKLLYHLHYSRPNWYKKYHSFTFAHYLHIGILVMTTVICGALLYQTWYGSPPSKKQAVLSAEDTAPPRTLSFQGRLLDNTNTPITAETPLRFTLYNSPTASGAAMLWQEIQNIKPDQNGNFNATLGLKHRLEQSIFTNNTSLYIGLTVGDNKELSPRQQIPTTEYAANADTVAGLKPITNSPDLAQNVLLALDSSGNLTIGGTSSHTFQATGGQFSISGEALLLTTNLGSNGNVKIAPDGSGIIDLEKPIQNVSNYTGPSGIPGAVEVDDILSVLATSSSHSALIVNQNGTGDIISGKSNGIDKFSLDKQGNEFIAGNLILNGDTIGTNSTSFDIAGSTVKNLSIGDNATVLTLGASSGITSINNSLSVQGITTLTGSLNTNGLITANAGLTIPTGQKLILSGFTSNGIPFINEDSQVVEDANNFSWDDSNDVLNINGTLCVQSASDVCGSASPGTIYAATYQTDTTADLAEDYISSQKLQPGDVVVLEGQGTTNAILKSTSPYQNGLIGIISTNPGITLNSGAKTDSAHPNLYPLALQGRVPVNVSTSNGPIEAGDDITSSSIPGVAMKATSSGQIIGKALESYTNSDQNAVGQIMVFVNLSYQTFPTTVTDDGNLANATESASLQNPTETVTKTNLLQSLEDITHTISLQAIQTGTLTTQSLEVTTDNIIIDGVSLKDYLTALVEQLIQQYLNQHPEKTQTTVEILSPIASGSAMKNVEPTQTLTPTITPTPSPIASSSAQIQNTPVQTASSSAVYIYNSIASSSAIASPSATPTPTSNVNETMKNATSSATDTDLANPFMQTAPTSSDAEAAPANFDSENNIDTQYEPVASLSAQLNSVPNMQANFATFNQGLIALGPTSLTDVGISGTLSINNNLRITADAINTIGSDLNIEPLKQGNILFMGGLVAIDTQGNLQVNGSATFKQNVTVHGQLAAGIIAPIPNQDLTINLKNKSSGAGSSLVITSATGSGVLKINQSGDLTSSGDATFTNLASNGFSIIRGAQADTSMTETVAQGSAGTGVITAYETQRTILTSYVTAHSLIYITPTSNTGNVTPYVARQTVQDPTNRTQGSFTVAIPTATTQNIGFNWWIVN